MRHAYQSLVLSENDCGKTMMMWNVNNKYAPNNNNCIWGITAISPSYKQITANTVNSACKTTENANIFRQISIAHTSLGCGDVGVDVLAFAWKMISNFTL